MEICLWVLAWVGYLCYYFGWQETAKPVPDAAVAGAGGERGDGRGWESGAAPLPSENREPPPRSQPVPEIAEVPRRWGRPRGGRAVAELSGIGDRLHMSADKSREAVAELPRSLQAWLGILGTGRGGGSLGGSPRGEACGQLWAAPLVGTA